MSGPIRKLEGARHGTDRRRPKTADDDRHVILVTEGLQGHWFPFGGGSSRCPGETLAKRTILPSLALVLKYLDVEVLDSADAMQTESSHRTLPFGPHAFDKQIPSGFVTAALVEVERTSIPTSRLQAPQIM